jgi:hypothetical protein
MSPDFPEICSDGVISDASILKKSLVILSDLASVFGQNLDSDEINKCLNMVSANSHNESVAEALVWLQKLDALLKWNEHRLY